MRHSANAEHSQQGGLYNMEKRKIIIGTYDTALTGLWTLRAWSLADPELIESYIEVPGRVDGPLDASTALSDGDPRYGSRPLAITLESSEGTRLEREARIDLMRNQLDGKRFDIILPDDPTHHVRGRVRVQKLYNDLAHASVSVSAVCEPWRYNNTDTVVSLVASTTEQTAALLNLGRRAVAPALTVTGGDVRIKFGADPETPSRDLSPKTYPPGYYPELFLTPGVHPLTYSGAGTILLTYREAVL